MLFPKQRHQTFGGGFSKLRQYHGPALDGCPTKASASPTGCPAQKSACFSSTSCAQLKKRIRDMWGYDRYRAGRMKESGIRPCEELNLCEEDCFIWGFFFILWIFVMRFFPSTGFKTSYCISCWRRLLQREWSNVLKAEAGTYVLLPYHEMRDDTNDSTTVRIELPPGEPSWKSWRWTS